MNIQKFRWSKVYESPEEELMALLREHKIKATRITSSAPGEQMQQMSKLDSIIWCAEGSFVISIGTASASLQPGDAIHIQAQTAYDLRAGISGFTYYLSP